jgi:hypothetical protein
MKDTKKMAVVYQAMPRRRVPNDPTLPGRRRRRLGQHEGEAC